MLISYRYASIFITKIKWQNHEIKMSENTNNYNGRWNEFSKNVMKSFGNLQKNEELCDIILISDDKVAMKAHKLVLSACSEFFSDLFMNEPLKTSLCHTNPIIFLGGIDSKTLKIIIEYIYFGETQIRSDDFDQFLEKAKKLKIFGLTETFSSLELHKPTDLLVPKVDIDNIELNAKQINTMDTGKITQGIGEDINDIDILEENIVSTERTQNECLDLSLKEEIIESTFIDYPKFDERYLGNAINLVSEDNEDAVLQADSYEVFKTIETALAEKTDITDKEGSIVPNKEHDNNISTKQYECTICAKSYNIKGSHYMHMVQKHGKESFLTWSKNQVKEAIPNNMTISQSKTTESRVIDSKTPKTVKSNKIIVSSQEEAETVLNKMYTKIDGEYKCTFCKARKKHISTLKYHMETHLEGLQYKCDKCSQVAKSRLSLYQHQRMKHQ